jgi:hypothetical protein
VGAQRSCRQAASVFSAIGRRSRQGSADDLGPRRRAGLMRWRMLAVVSLGIIALTLNWPDVATA